MTQLFRTIDAIPDRFLSGAVTIGNFDGVHRGHVRLVENVLAAAKRIGGPSLVLTFDPHPAKILRPELAPVPLTWTQRKVELLEALGVDAVIAWPTDEALLGLSPEQFFQTVLVDVLRARAVVEGPNFFFGKDRAGDIEGLGTLCDANGIRLTIVEPLRRDGEFVSSSRIRQAISAGQIAQANQMLTRPYRVRGVVVRGAGRGAGIGFPTANLEAIETLLPSDGVYRGQVQIDRKTYDAAINVGPNPTFAEQARKVEIHVIDFTGPLYDAWLEVDFLDKLRDIRKFRGADELCAQLKADVQAARSNP